VALTAAAIEELKFWINSVNQLNEKGNDLHESDLCDLDAESVCDSIDLLTDCSLVAPSISLNTVAGSWTKSESGKSSTWRELEAVRRTVKSSLTLLKYHGLKLNTDNKNVTSIVKNGSKKFDLQIIARELNTENNIKIKANWIPREQNKIADGPS
jgi:hypothetical protein